MEQQRNDSQREPAFREDAPFFSRMSWTNLKGLGTVAAVGGSIVAAVVIMQFQFADYGRRLDRFGDRMDKGDAADRVRDSTLTIINYERTHGLYPAPRAEKAHRAMVVRQQGPPKRPRDHTAVDFAGLWANFPFPSSFEGAGWSNTEGHDLRRGTVIRGEP